MFKITFIENGKKGILKAHSKQTTVQNYLTLISDFNITEVKIFRDGKDITREVNIFLER